MTNHHNLKVISKYTSPKCKRATNDPPLQTLRVTSNIDTEMFEVFASDHQNYGINLANISRPRVEIIEGLDIVVFGYTDQENVLLPRLWSVPNIFILCD